MICNMQSSWIRILMKPYHWFRHIMLFVDVRNKTQANGTPP